ncbi:hypothetical protein GGS20DRAFT_217407 [Poronia punctata]|nr:hypothetical protein GGS20DRAFT_217407 [Poronia punctata]
MVSGPPYDALPSAHINHCRHDYQPFVTSAVEQSMLPWLEKGRDPLFGAKILLIIVPATWNTKYYQSVQPVIMLPGPQLMCIKSVSRLATFNHAGNQHTTLCSYITRGDRHLQFAGYLTVKSAYVRCSTARSLPDQYLVEGLGRPFKYLIYFFPFVVYRLFSRQALLVPTSSLLLFQSNGSLRMKICKALAMYNVQQIYYSSSLPSFGVTLQNYLRYLH